MNKFLFEADAPDLSKIPNTEIVGVTVILLSCAYDDREFVRVGYYVNNEYSDEALIADPPSKPIIEKVRRNILAEKPRVTRFAIKWLVPALSLQAMNSRTNMLTGTPKSLLLLSTLLSSLKPMLLKMTRLPTVRRSSLRRRLSQLRKLNL